ncbi:MAG: helix-turn-helix domain-containing protein, partial [Cypionkella sp.]
AITYFMAKLKRSRDAIVRALGALRDHGFLDWLRRYVPTGNETGPQVQQTSNAYRLSLPARALRLLGWRAAPAPLPDDFVQHQVQRAAQRDVLMGDMHPVDRAVTNVEDEGLAAVLAALGHAMFLKKERESAERTESGTISIY